MAHQVERGWVVSPQDLVAEFECGHKFALESAVRSGALPVTVAPDDGLDLLREQGIRHEHARLESLDASLRVKRLGSPAHTIDAYRAAWVATRQAIDDGYDVIYQATLFTGDFIGIPDFLILARDEGGAVVHDAKGRPVYEPVDAKSARSAKRGAVLQVAAYADAMVRLDLPVPVRVHLWLAGDDDWSGSADTLIPLAREYRERVVARLPVTGRVPQPDWAAPCEACARCRWALHCDEGRRKDRDLSLVQGIRSLARQRLVDAGVATIDAMATAGDEDRPAAVSGDTFNRLRAQADLQLQGERIGHVLHEVIDPAVLGELPPRSPGDLWFDMEGDPFAGDGRGLEYMFGFGSLAGGTFEFDTTEADDAATECRAFEDFIDLVTVRRTTDPAMHVYHYADYERRTLLRLAQQYGTRESELDILLRHGVFVDLYSLVRRGVRFSTESLSLKYIEGVYGVTHSAEDVSTAMDSVIQYERCVALRQAGQHVEAASILTAIRSYNRLDCESTLKLDSWLRTITPPKRRLVASNLEGDQQAQEDSGDAPAADPHADLIQALEAGMPVDARDRTPLESARALMAGALQYHPRERRPAWWHLFELIKAAPDDLDRANGVLLAEGVTSGEWVMNPRARKLRRLLNITSHEDPRDVLDAAKSVFLLYDPAPEGVTSPADTARGYHSAELVEVDSDSVQAKERAGRDNATWPDAPIAVLPGAPIDTTAIVTALAAAAQVVIDQRGDDQWTFPEVAWADLLLCRPPRRNGPLPRTGDDVADIVAALRTTDNSYVAVQGPPGTGKTYVGSRSVARLVEAGWRIGVVAQSHSVVDNFLDAVLTASPGILIGKEPQAGSDVQHPWHIRGKIDAWAGQQSTGYVIGGTAWTYARPNVRDLDLDLIVIDEAVKFALPNAIASTFAARRALLLGDPQQLPQVSQASHPDGVEASVLGHIIRGHATMPTDRGYFLDRTYRMHPDLTAAVSRLQYEGKLSSAPVTATRDLDGIPPGISSVPIAHNGNTTTSVEESEAVVELVRRLLGRSWTDARNDTVVASRAMTQADVIVVAAYNGQVRLIKRTLAEAGFAGVEVGTVDKFQGRESAAVIVSMATSSAEDLPRGVEFLLSPNRLNVAVSRAQWVSYLVHSPALRLLAPPSVIGMERLGGFLGLLQRAVS